MTVKLNSLKVEIPILGSSDGESPQLLLTGLHINIQIQHITSSKIITKCVYMINCQITEQHNQNLIHIHSNIYSYKYTPTTHQNLQISPKTVFCSKIEISQTSLGVDWAVCLTAHVDRAFSEI